MISAWYVVPLWILIVIDSVVLARRNRRIKGLIESNCQCNRDAIELGDKLNEARKVIEAITAERDRLAKEKDDLAEIISKTPSPRKLEDEIADLKSQLDIARATSEIREMGEADRCRQVHKLATLAIGHLDRINEIVGPKAKRPTPAIVEPRFYRQPWSGLGGFYQRY